MKKFCTKCGNPVEPDSIFCRKCGTKIVEEQSNTNENSSHETSASSSEEVFRDKLPETHEGNNTSVKELPNKKILIGICSAFAVVVLVIIIALIIQKSLGNNLSGTHGNNPDIIAPVIGENNSIVSLSLSEYVDGYNATLRRTVSSYTNKNVSDSDYISCAKTLINKALKNPSSAQYNSTSVYEKDDYGRAIVYLDVSAQNSFGGWVRSEYYVCIQNVKSDGTFTYNSSVPYTDENSSYDILLMMNAFGDDPADEELKGLIFEYGDFVTEGPSFAVLPTQSLNCYKLVFDYGFQFVYVDTKTKNVVSVQTSFNNTSGYSNDCEKICAASVATLTGTSMSSAKENIANVMSLSGFTPTSTPTFYDSGYVYDCGYGFSDVDMAVTIANEDSYDSGLYWSPNNEETYYVNLADQYAENKDYDNAIIYYEYTQISGDKLNTAYYGKAEQSFAEGDFDTASLYFDYAGNYKDSAVRVLEVFYSAGQKHEENKDYNSAIYSYSMAGDYSDAKAKYKECNFKQGELDISNKQYFESATCFENAADYEGASEKYKEACYLYAEQELLTGSTEPASTYFMKAGDYKDAATRMKKYYYDKGTGYLESKDYLKATDSFKQVMDYSDASVKYKEAWYLYAGQELLKGSTEPASTYFKKAGDYKDAATRMQKYYYDKGTGYLASKDYLKATDSFKQVMDYSDASVKYKEANYLYGEELLSQGNVESAKAYFYNAKSYSDADTRIQRYYYEGGEALLKSTDYLAAAEKFILAGNYSDSKTKEKECYYEYGKAQLVLSYTTSGISYLEKCRGFKDTNEYVLSHYFKEAETLFNTYMNTNKSFKWENEPTYETVSDALTRCEGYSNSNKMISVLDIVQELWLSADKSFRMITIEKPALEVYTYHMEGFTATYTDSTITLYEETLQNGYSYSHEATIITDYKKSYFKATVKKIFEVNPWGGDSKDIIRCIIAMFTKNYNDVDLADKLVSKMWVELTDGYQTEIKYGGYNIVITSSHVSFGCINLVIEATK
ncbi:MAG: zinc-ribbon domain-containing protein [Eubacteriales bacterium]